MDTEAWWATVHGGHRVGHNLKTKNPRPPTTSEWEDYSNYFGEEAEISRSLVFDGQPWNCHVMVVCHRTYTDVLHQALDEAQGELEVKYSTILDLVGPSFCYILWPSHSFKGYALLSLHF